MHTKLIENRNLAWVGGIVSHYRQPQCVADVDLWLSLGVCWIKGLVNEGGVWAGGVEKARPHGCRQKRVHLTGRGMPQNWAVTRWQWRCDWGNISWAPSALTSASCPPRPLLQLGRHRRTATICTQLWRKLNAIALHSSGHKREREIEKRRTGDRKGE